MQYDFSKILAAKELVLNDFINTYTSCIDIENEPKDLGIEFYSQIFNTFEKPFEDQAIFILFEKLAHFKISQNMPYIIMSNEIFSLENMIIAWISSNDLSSSELVKTLKLFKEINNKVAYIYLIKYTKSLISQNTIRQNSLSDLIEKNIIKHYESHLVWLSDLALHIQQNDQKNFPQLNPSICNFGKWLNTDAKMTIKNNSKFKSIVNIHNNLHIFAEKIYKILEKGEHHILITYLEKCELISLSIGTELALLDQILINQKITKDTLTGSLNRHALKNVFESQYELSLATSNPFVMAMCDLDFFKEVNDKYGHIAGDKMLKLFVDVVKKNIRNSDIIIRYGGEEFIILLPTLFKEKGYEVLDKIRKAFESASLEHEGQTIKATVSIGMMEIKPEYAFKLSFTDEYIMIVDKNLYMAKEAGRNTVQAY